MKSGKRLLKSMGFFATALMIAMLAAPQAQANLVTNGGFETGNFSGWTTHTCNVGPCGAQGEFIGSFPHTGSFAAATACVDQASCLNPTSGDFISQALSTVVGGTYTLTFWLRPDGGTPNGETVYWNGGLVGSFINEPSNVYTEFTISNLAATSTSTVLQFNGFHGPATIYLDDIVVVASTTVPEPMPLLLLSAGLVGMGISLRRKRK